MNRTDSTSHTHPSWCDPRACDHDPLYPRHAGPLNGWKAAEDDVVVSLTLKRDDETTPAPNSERILGPVLVDLNLRCTALACTCDGPERDQEATAALTPDDCDRLARQLQAAATNPPGSRLTAPGWTGDRTGKHRSPLQESVAAMRALRPGWPVAGEWWVR